MRKSKLNECGWSRREFVAGLGAAGAAVLSGHKWTESRAGALSDGTRKIGRKKVALLATEVRKYSHAQHFIDRLLEGWGWRGGHHYPEIELVSLYVDQFPEGDLSRERERRHGVRIYPTIEEALTLGGSTLSVDGVLIIAEHGRYPKNAKGQTLYPRHAFFKKTVGVFERSGRSVPVFNDKHLSTDWAESMEMVADAKRLGFAFLAGSSLPVTWRLPALEIPLGTALEESVCVCYGGVDSYDFHGLETAQCMSERRAGGERGVKAVHAVQGDNVWAQLEKRPETKDLVWNALGRSHTLKPLEGYTFARPSLEHLRAVSPDATAYFLEHNGGFRTTMLLLNGVKGATREYGVLDFTYAGRAKNGDVYSCQMHLPMPPRIATLANFFNPQMHHIEQTILKGEASYPVERTLLTTGMTAFAVDSLYRGQKEVMTPELAIEYAAPPGGLFWNS